MSKPAFVFDGRNLLDHDSLRKIEFVVCGIEKPDPKNFVKMDDSTSAMLNKAPELDAKMRHLIPPQVRQD